MSKKNGKKDAANLTPVKKIETKPAEVPVAQPKAAEVPVRPEMPVGFCMDLADWNSDHPCYDPGNKICKDPKGKKSTCEKDTPEAHAACLARYNFLMAQGKSPKIKKEKGVRVPRTKIAGTPTQTAIINSMLKEKKTIEEMATQLAPVYDGNIANAKGRIQNHIKSILKKACVSAKLFGDDELNYLKSETKVAEVAPAA